MRENQAEFIIERVARKVVDLSIHERTDKIISELSENYIENKSAILKMLKYALSELSSEQLIELHELREDFDLNNLDEDEIENNTCISCGEIIEDSLCFSCHSEE